MNSIERRRYQRYKAEFGVTIHKGNEIISATMIDISEGGIGVITENVLLPGTEVYIKFQDIDDYSIHGTVKWAFILNKSDRISYRIGIEANSILIEAEGHTVPSPDRSEFVKKLLSG